MPGWFWIVLAVSIVGELLTVWIVLQRVRAQQGGLADLDFGAIRELSGSIEQCASEHLAANFGGEPAELPDALRTLLPKVREIVRTSGLTLDERAVRLLVTNAVAATRRAPRGEILRALDGIPNPEQATAA
jgi:hypothetical protein